MRRNLKVMLVIVIMIIGSFFIMVYQFETMKFEKEVVMSRTFNDEQHKDEVNQDTILGFGEDQEPEIVEIMVTDSMRNSFDLLLTFTKNNL